MRYRSLLGLSASTALLCSLPLVLAGCGAAAEDEGHPGAQFAKTDEPAEVGVTQQGLDPSWATARQHWYQNWGTGPVYLAPTSTHVCVLNYIKGKFLGGGEEVKVYQSGGSWYLNGKSQQTGIGAAATCFARNKFIAPDGYTLLGQDALVWKTGTGSVSGEAWWGDATTFINGFAGNLTNSADYISIEQSNGAYTPSRAHVYIGGSGRHMKNYYLSFFAGAGGRLAKFWEDRTYSASSMSNCITGTGGHTEVPMAPVNDAMCHFTKVGNSNNWEASNYVSIPAKVINGIERWVLVAHSSACNNTRISYAEARCLKRDQR